jgi:uncharacterized membrane protein YfcA
MIDTYALILLTGVAVGLLSTVFGVGGGIIMVPILSLILPYSHIEAVATSLATIFFVASLNTYHFHKTGIIVWKIVPWVVLTSSVFSFLAARIAVLLPENILVGIFICVLFWVAVQTFLLNTKKEGKTQDKPGKFIPLAIGALIGTISGTTGVGGGAITTPVMLISGLVKNVQATPTSNAIMIFTTLFGSLSFALTSPAGTQGGSLGLIHLDTAILLFTGSAFFSKYGVSINQKFPLFWRKTILGLLLLFICLRLVIMLVIV